MVREIGLQNSIFNQFLREVRDQDIQRDRARFRRNMERIAEILAYEISKDFDYEVQEVTTSLGTAQMRIPSAYPVLATIMRAGLPFHQGFLNYFDHSDSAFVSAYRTLSKDKGDFIVDVEYFSCPDIDGRELIVSDPMLATGSSMVKVLQALLKNGKPSHIHIATILATREGINRVKRGAPSNVTIWTGAIDDELTAQAYIVPGLGDAGDLAFGKKS